MQYSDVVKKMWYNGSMKEGAVINKLSKIERDKNGSLPRMTLGQKNKASAMIKKLCCNYASGECIILNCDCAQINSCSVICKWFRQAILPQDEALSAELIKPLNRKRCAICGKAFIAKSNRAKCCSACSVNERRKKKARNERKYRELKRGHLEN